MPRFKPSKSKPTEIPPTSPAPPVSSAPPPSASHLDAPVSASRAMPDDSSRKGLLSRLRNLQLPTNPVRMRMRNDHSSSGQPNIEHLPDDASAPYFSQQPSSAAPAEQHQLLQEQQQHARTARRKQRRAERSLKEDDWNERFRRRRNDAIVTGVDMKPLTPLSSFDSKSDTETISPAQVPDPVEHLPQPSHPSHPPPAYDEDVPAPLTQPTSDIPLTYDAIPIAEGFEPPPGYPSSSSQRKHVPSPPPLQTSAPPSASSRQPAPVSRDPAEDAQLAEMFAAQAFPATSAYPPPAPSHMPPPSSSYAAPMQESVLPPDQDHPTPLGWGGVFHAVPSQPMYGKPVHLSPAPRGPLDVDPMLSEKIRRGRELASLATEQEERGNLGAAETGYMKALSILVPATKDLDVGSELNKNSRMQQKAKIKREAAAMLDRCEELRRFLLANGPAVPSQMPAMPNVPQSRDLQKKSSLGEPPSREPPLPPPTYPVVGRASPAASPPRSRDPSPPHQPPEVGRSRLLTRLNSRKDMLASASSALLPEARRQPLVQHPPPPSKPQWDHPPAPKATCFMCSAGAHLRTRCGHTYCSNCGNQAVHVFGHCPVPGCGEKIRIEEFEHILES